MFSYCECLKAGRECGPHCSCVDCYNHADRVERQKALMFLKRKNSATLRSAQVVILSGVIECRENRRFVAAIARRVNVARSTAPVICPESPAVPIVTV